MYIRMSTYILMDKLNKCKTRWTIAAYAERDAEGEVDMTGGTYTFTCKCKYVRIGVIQLYRQYTAALTFQG